MNPRRWLCILLPLLTLWVTGLAGCATTELIEQDCRMAQVTWTNPVPKSGRVTVEWEVNAAEAQRRCPQSRNPYGCTVLDGDVARIWLEDENRPDCAVRKLAHELRHGLQQRHVRKD